MPERYIYAEHEGNRMVRKGDWKLVSANFKGDEWELYNIKEDRNRAAQPIGKISWNGKRTGNGLFRMGRQERCPVFPENVEYLQ